MTNEITEKDYGFDLNSAFLRRFSNDATSALHAFVSRVDEALPGAVVREERRAFGIFGKKELVGVKILINDTLYSVEIQNNRPTLKISRMSGGIVISNRTVAADVWFDQLKREVIINVADAKKTSDEINQFLMG